ncbi:hypothetical protein M885DRAFT_508226 [Pelagophyceae sp. CCMP2097]|nr:hypothetical protein M885DRAFT_508226 [Pelagophyceae sp. CCMP2097]
MAAWADRRASTSRATARGAAWAIPGARERGAAAAMASLRRPRRRVLAALLAAGLAASVGAYPRLRCDPTSEAESECSACPRGSYRPRGSRRAECVACPRGRYGSTVGLETAQCTAHCPAGKFNDLVGAQTPEDCKFCPPGRYGVDAGLNLGLTTAKCSGSCPAGKYSSVFGLTTALACVPCPAAYRGWQCSEIVKVRKGFFDSTNDGRIDERAHAYIRDNEDIPQGESPLEFKKLNPPLRNANE